MQIKPVKNMDFLEAAILCYRQFWERAWQGHPHPQSCHFDGGLGDLRMLAYCDYELGHPDATSQTAALLFANIIATNTDLCWGEDTSGAYYLFSAQAYPRFACRVSDFVMALSHSGLSQFDSFEVLSEKILLELLMAGFELSELTGLKAIVDACRADGCETYSEKMLDAIARLYDLKEADLDGFLSLLPH